MQTFAFCYAKMHACFFFCFALRTLLADIKMADVSSNDRKIKLTKNGKVVKRRTRNPEGKLKTMQFKK